MLKKILGYERPKYGDGSSPAKLPEHLREKTSRDMKAGDSTWTVPWMIDVASDRSMWVKSDAIGFGKGYGGTACLFLTRVKDGWAADLYNSTYVNTGIDREHYKWRASNDPPEHFKELGCEPVLELRIHKGAPNGRG